MGWKSIVREFTPPIVMKVLRPPRRSGGFISATETIAAAKAAGLSVSDYVNRDQPRSGTALLDKLCELKLIGPETKSVVEIGGGTGSCLEALLKRCRPTLYQVYEIDAEWSAWLAKTYPIEACPADGRSLKSTSSRSCDFIHSHGVFVYLPFLVSYCYFKEIARVAAPGCVVTFNVFSEECLDAETAEKWLASGYEHVCLLSSAYVKNFFEANGFRFVNSFISPYGPGKSEYLVFRR
jgi:SAM-dependent methyltransferase